MNEDKQIDGQSDLIERVVSADSRVSDNSSNHARDDDSDNDDDIFNKSRKKAVIISDDEDEAISVPNAYDGISSDKEDGDIKDIEREIKKRIVLNESDSEDEVSHPFSENESGPQEKKVIQYRSDIFDTEETDDDEPRENTKHWDSDHDEKPTQTSEKVSHKQRKSSNKMSEKERKREMQEIHSTTQRMIRESEISLPYHRPKQRTLKEFLDRKKPLAKPDKRRSLKMSMRDMDYLREIEERKKEVDTFFKSDSEEEEQESTDRMEETEDKTMEVDEEVDVKSDTCDDHVEKSVDEHELITSEKFTSSVELVHQLTDTCGSLIEADAFVCDKSALDKLTERDKLQSTEDLKDQISDAQIDDYSDLPDLFVEYIDSGRTSINRTDDSVTQTKSEHVQNEESSFSIPALTKSDRPKALEVLILENCQDSMMMTDKLIKSSLNLMDIEDGKSRDTDMTSVPEDDWKFNGGGIDAQLNCPNGLAKPVSKNTTEFDTEEDLRLHFDTEDFDDNPENDTKAMESSQDLRTLNRQMESNASSETKTSDLQSKSKVLTMLSKKYPHLNIDEISGVTPRLNSGKDEFIELDEVSTSTHKKGVSELLHRFVKHSNTKKQPADAQKVALGVVSKEVSAEGEEKLVHSQIFVNLDAEEGRKTKDETPGARLTRLKKVLRAQLLAQREKERQRREKEKQFLDSEQVIQDYHDDGLPNEEPELTDQSDTDFETESEPEENDVILQDKKRKKNKFLDQEAEVDELDCSDDEAESDNGQESDSNENGLGDAEGENQNDESDDSEGEVHIKKSHSRRKLNWILDDEDEPDTVIKYDNTPDAEDSGNLMLCLDDAQKMEEENSQEKLANSQDFQNSMENSSKSQNTQENLALPPSSYCRGSQSSLSRASTEDLFATPEDENIVNQRKDSSFEFYGSVLAGHQPWGGFKEKPNSSDPVTQDEPKSLTPFSKLGILRQESFSQEVDQAVECANHQSALNFLLTPLKDSQIPATNSENIKRSLLLESSPIMDKTADEAKDELLGLCSGNFIEENGKKEQHFSQDFMVETQSMKNLIGLCSGQFTTQVTKAGQGFMANQRPDRTDEDEQPNSLKRRSLSADTVVLSASPPPLQSDEAGLAGESPATVDQLPLVDSSDEEGDTVDPPDEGGDKKRESLLKKKRKRIVHLSDDSSSGEDDDNEQIELEDDESVEYDEDERPITKEKFSGFKDYVKGGIRADFLEKEAELSGSDFESGDEEEPTEDNDIMELEEGDLEKFDEEELRNQVGRAHLKSLIDEDKREVRLLQELYLEDGDLHGQGRQRKFRWRNINNKEEDETVRSDEEEKDEEVEEEAEWRKLRFEREKFLKEHSKAKDSSPSPVKLEEVIPSLEKTVSLKFVRSASLKAPPLKPSNSTHSQDSLPLLIDTRSKKGSFLRRDEITLKRLAEFTKENQTVVGTAKQGGNFVFQTLTAKEVDLKATEERSGPARKPPPKIRRIERSFFSMDESLKTNSIFNYL